MAPKSFSELRGLGWEELVASVDQALREVENFQYNNQPALYMKAQVLLTEIARRDQDQQMNKMLDLSENTAIFNRVTMDLSKDMVRLNRLMVWCTIAITLMTVAILGLTLYMALVK